ncbi:MAG: hypothetical protein JSS34_07835 [Proteobacteria bacterium]|nr:hypothetical protein [Pseudomonadota bacterium]
MTITYLRNVRISESFHKIFQGKEQPSSTTFQALLLQFLEEEKNNYTNRYEEMKKDKEKFELWQPTSLHREKYYPTDNWKDLKVLTICPFNYHLYAAMMTFLDDTYRRLGLLQEGKSLVEGDSGFKYGPYDKRYVGAYVLQCAEKRKA